MLFSKNRVHLTGIARHYVSQDSDPKKPLNWDCIKQGESAWLSKRLLSKMEIESDVCEYCGSHNFDEQCYECLTI
jgi:hypothetical protein